MSVIGNQNAGVKNYNQSRALKVITSTMCQNVHSGNILRHSNPMKPFLKDSNMKVQVWFYLSMIETSSISHDPIFLDIYDNIHIDEKWYHISKKYEKYYLLREERDLVRSYKSKKN